MNLDQLTQGILAKFANHRIVFWHDPEQSFQSDLPALALDGIALLDMQGRSLFETKKRIELDEPEQRFLLYFPYAEPEPEKDWLLDMRLYSEQFFADASSMLLHELGIPKMGLRTHIRARSGFFNKKNTAALKKLVTENEDELSLDRKMMAVLLKADSAELADILLSLLKDYAQVLEAGTDTARLPSMALLHKHGLPDSLWALLQAEFSYQAKEPSLTDFTLKLFCTELWSQMDSLDRDWLLQNVLKTAAGRSTALALLVNWRDSRSYSEHYQTIASVLERQLEISRRLENCTPDYLVSCKTFEAVEQIIIRGLVSALLEADKALDHAYFESVLSERRTSYWHRVRDGYYAHIYTALQQAERLFGLRHSHPDGFHYASARDMFIAYAQELFGFDQAYRQFKFAVRQVANQGGDILRRLDEAVENLYTNWYLYELGLAWDRHLASEERMANWVLSGVPSQQQFYERQIRSLLAGKQVKRVFVVISDALRYEVAEELASLINAEKRFKAEIASQLGVLPSYTQLGMAALLPHKQLTYASGQAVVQVDGQSSAGLENRNRILTAVNGMAVSSKDVMGWSKQEGRDQVRDKAVVYIYHNTIDDICDKQGGEDRTPEVCRDAIAELNHLVGRIVNNLNGSRIIITADHGFLFQQQALEQTGKTELSVKPVNTIETKKRYIVGRQLPTYDECWKGRIADTADGGDDTGFLLPKGAQRFHFVGGARFVHGGAMLQEICVPVVHIRELEKESIAQHEKQPVGVVAASQPIRLVNNIDKVRFIQTDPLGERYKARKLEVYVLDAMGNVVSSREPLSFDSTSSVMEERIREARLKLVGSGFDRRKQYKLVLEDMDTRTRYSDYAVTIDLAFGQDDFF
ncbi:BREX-1 system phosphatase PglZ type A [Thiothrix nivea]|uniref:Uncharacterized protein n=1 Tax=Thiothrix nivea (strain ATCC 35100 / DSM 5205 / JP2) TaxID=870187 RepID=A0A656HN16_THINJ|nr:BREX-1 system phosphatase PglZ type A [Thiothrix nivea]EIJ36729.1 hypothetical protein Thini_4242 [Thiothrix nivea DSM 5205]